MTELQNKLLEMLCEIDEICKKHGIDYCLFAGSALGADRHKGFIPWDDDADIIMTLENYEKFLKVFDSEAKDGRVLNCLEKSTEYPFTYARYVDINTTAIQRHTSFGGCDPGVKIDIFVAVPTHKSMKKAEKHRMEILAFSEVICPYAVMVSYRPEGFKKAYDREKKLFDKLGREKYIAKRLNALKYYRTSSSDKYALFSGMMSNSYIIDSDIFDETVDVPFENTRLSVSKRNLKFTKQLYGEGWMFKPEGVEKPRHTYLLDLDTPYKHYLDKLWGNLDLEKMRKIAIERKRLHMIQRDNYTDVLINNQLIKNLAVELGINKLCRELHEHDLNNWYKTYSLLSEFYEVQLKRINVNYSLFIPINECAFETAMNAAIMVGKYYEAAEIIKIGFDAGCLSLQNDKIKLIIKRIDACIELVEALYYYKDIKKAKQILELFSNDSLGKSLTFETARLWIAALENNNVNELQRICKYIDETFAEDIMQDEILAIKACCVEKMGDVELASRMFYKAQNNTTNGFVYQYLINKGINI